MTGEWWAHQAHLPGEGDTGELLLRSWVRLAAAATPAYAAVPQEGGAEGGAEEWAAGGRLRPDEAAWLLALSLRAAVRRLETAAAGRRREGHPTVPIPPAKARWRLSFAGPHLPLGDDTFGRCGGARGCGLGGAARFAAAAAALLRRAHRPCRAHRRRGRRRGRAGRRRVRDDAVCPLSPRHCRGWVRVEGAASGAREAGDVARGRRLRRAPDDQTGLSPSPYRPPPPSSRTR